jgi:hypothetical protein
LIRWRISGVCDDHFQTSWSNSPARPTRGSERFRDAASGTGDPPRNRSPDGAKMRLHTKSVRLSVLPSALSEALQGTFKGDGYTFDQAWRLA